VISLTPMGFGPAAELLLGASRRAEPLLWSKSSQNP
jgi:hypothetical protein